MSESSRIEDLGLRAVWDGVEDHAVQVNLSIRVRALPGTRHILLRGCGQLVEEATVIDIREVLPSSTKSKAQGGSQQSKVPVRDTSRKTATEPGDQKWTLETPQRTRLATLYGDITTSKSFSAAAAARRWEEIKTENAWDSSTSCDLGSVDGELSYEVTRSNNEVYTPLDETALGNTLSSNTSYGIHSGTLDKPPPISLCDSLTGLNINKRHDGAGRNNFPRRKLPSYFFHANGRLEFNARLRHGLERPPWSTAPRTKTFRPNSSSTPSRRPWRPPGLSDFSPRSNTLAAWSPRSTAAIQLASQTSGTTRLIKCNPSVASSLRKYQSQETLLVTRHDTSGNVKTNGKNICKSRRSLSCSSCASCSNSSLTSSASDFKVYATAKIVKRNTEVCNIEIEPKPLEVINKSISVATEPFELDIRSEESLREFIVSPPTSPRSWLRYRGASTQYHKYLAQPSRNKSDRLSWAIESGDLYIDVVDDGKPSIFEVEIEAKISLISTALQHQYSFHVPGLPQAELGEDRIATGAFAFFIDPTSYNPAPSSVRFTAKGLEDCRIKDSSHVIGRFGLDEAPQLYMQVKVPIYHIPEFSTTVVMCATLIQNPKGGLMVNYRTRLMCETPATDIYADQVEFLFVVKHGHSEAGHPTYEIDNGSCTIIHETVDSFSSDAKTGTLLKITQNVDNSQNAMTITFSIPYRTGCHAMPRFQPLSGSTSAETVLLTCPKLPLIFKHVPKEPLSMWKALQYIEAGHRIIKLERQRMPKFFPEGLNDDPLMSISELYRVQFTGLESADNAWGNASPVSVARHLQITLTETLGGYLECRLNIDVEVGKNAKVLMVDAHGWQPCYSTIDGRLVTELSGEWRELSDTYLALFKTASMLSRSTAHVVLHFRRVVEAAIPHEADNKPKPLGCATQKLWLPKIVGKTLLGSTVYSDLEVCTVRLTDELESGIFTQRLQRNDLNKLSLPKLSPGYDLSIEYEGGLRDHELFMPQIKAASYQPVKPALCGITLPTSQSKQPDNIKVHFVDTAQKSLTAESDRGTVEAPKSKSLKISDLIECPEKALPSIPAMDSVTDTISKPCAPRTGCWIGWKTVAFTLLASILTLHYEDGMRLSSGFLGGYDIPHQAFDITRHKPLLLHASMGNPILTPMSSPSTSTNAEQDGISYATSTDGPALLDSEHNNLPTVPQPPHMDRETAGEFVHRRRGTTFIDRIDYALGWRG